MRRGPDNEALLAQLVGDRRLRDDAPLPEIVRWLEEITRVADAVLESPAARAAITDLRAALGAVVQWGRGPRTEEKLVELQLLVRALVTRGSAGLLGSLAQELRDLADAGVAAGIDAEACRTAAAAFDDAALARAQGRAIEPLHVDAMRALRDATAQR